MSRLTSSPASAETRSWPPTLTSPAGSQPNATSGFSPPIASTLDTPNSLRVVIRPTCSPGTAHALVAALDRALPLGERLLDERLSKLPPEQAQLEAAWVVAARPAACWDDGSWTISSRLDAPHHAVRQTLLAQVKDW